TDATAQPIPPAALRELRTEISLARSEAQGIEKELTAVREQLVLGQDQAGTGDELAQQRADLRDTLRTALDAEQRAIAALLPGLEGDVRVRVGRLTALAQKAALVGTQLDHLNQSIDAIVDETLSTVRRTLEEEYTNLVAYRQAFLAHEAESRQLGGELLASSFRTVAQRFYEIMIRAEVGLVDVSWAMKEIADQATRRLELGRARERRTLDTEFADTLKEAREA